MPDAEGRFKGVFVPADAWERIFGRDSGYHDRRLARRLEDPEFRAEFERAAEELDDEAR